MSFIPRNDNSIHRRDLGLTKPWEPRIRDENEALPKTISFWDQPVYQPPKNEFVRAGAMDFKQIKSK